MLCFGSLWNVECGVVRCCCVLWNLYCLEKISKHKAPAPFPKKIATLGPFGFGFVFLIFCFVFSFLEFSVVEFVFQRCGEPLFF